MADYGGFDYFNQLKGKVHELKVRRDGINQEVMRDRSAMLTLEEQIADLQRQHQKVKLDCEGKDSQLRKYNDLIDQSESALNKMIQNSQKLTDALSSALDQRGGI